MIDLIEPDKIHNISLSTRDIFLIKMALKTLSSNGLDIIKNEYLTGTTRNKIQADCDYMIKLSCDIKMQMDSD